MKKIFLLLTTCVFSLTLLQAQTTLWTEDFEGGSLPTGWLVDNPSYAGVFDNTAGVGTSHGGSYFLYTFGTGQARYIHTSSISMEDGVDYTLKLWAKNGTLDGSNIKIHVDNDQDHSNGYISSDITTQMTSASYAEITATYSNSGSNTYYFVIESGIGGTYANANIDDVSLTKSAGSGGPSISTAAVSPSCYGGSDGSISTTVSGGATPYSYAWSNGASTAGISGLSAGVYGLTVTDNASATATASTTVTDPAQLSITSESTTPLDCNGDTDATLTITATGGTGTKTYDIGSTNTTGLFTGLGAGDYTVTVTDGNGCKTTGTTQSITEPSALGVNSLSIADVSGCGGNDGEVDIVGSGGVGSFTYDIGASSNSTGHFPGLTVGNYTITISDANLCEYEKTNIVVAETGAPDIILEQKTDITCYGLSDGTVTVTATGGTGTINYDIGTGTQTSGVFSGLAAGDYNVTITDGGSCTVYASTQTISEPAELSLTAEAYTSVTGCYGDASGTLSYTATGGTGTLDFDIGSANNASGDFLALPAGDYQVTVTDANSCTDTGSTLTISQPAMITVDAGTDQTICEGASLLLDVTGTGTVTWSGSISDSTSVEPTTNTTYYVTLTDADGCTATDSIVISVNPAPTVELAVSTDTLISGNSATLTASGASSYSWNKTGLSGASVSVSPTTSATYTVTGTDANGCTDKASETIIVIADDTDGDGSDTTDTYVNKAGQVQLTLYPNPSSGILYVESETSISKVEIYNQSTLVKAIAPLEGNMIDLSDLRAGVYYIRIYTGQSIVLRKISVIK